jgi:cell division protein FtsQ
MDGRGRFLRSVTRLETRYAPAPAFAPAQAVPRRIKTARGSGRRRQTLLRRVLDRLAGPGIGAALAIGVIGGAGVYGAVRGGHFDAFIASEGAPVDILAKAFGFAIDTITIAGLAELDEARVLAAAQISPRNSLPFLDAGKVRERLTAIPLVKEAAVAKLYPDRLLITIEERRPYALWQKDGEVYVVAADGTPLDEMRGRRFAHLPHVVGAGANEKAADYVALLEAAGDLGDKIRAGILVSHRRWILKTTNGLDIHLPETNPAAAVASLMDLQRSSGILDKDVLSLDLRQPGRVVARLSEEASAARADKVAHKGKAKGGQT